MIHAGPFRSIGILTQCIVFTVPRLVGFLSVVKDAVFSGVVIKPEAEPWSQLP